MAVTIDVRDDVARDAIADVVAWLHHVDETFSTYRPDSPISRYGRGDLRADELDDEVLAVLDLCDLVRADSAGAFDAHAVDAPTGGRFDPSGLVKGWSVERAARILEAHGAENFSINAGGDIVLRGSAHHDVAWRTGIRHPDQPDRLATVLAAHGPLAIATSATYERGQHIVDPRSAAPATALASVTVVGPDLTFADAYATAVYVMGLDGLLWLDDWPGYGGYAVTRPADGRPAMAYSTAEFDRHRVR